VIVAERASPVSITVDNGNELQSKWPAPRKLSQIEVEFVD
jgi:hypothetical protein